AIADQKQRSLWMGAALDALDPQIAGIIKRRIVLGLNESELVEHGVTVTRAIHQQLGARVETDEKILVAIVAGLHEVGQSIARAPHLVTAHRTRNVEQDTHRNRR